MTEICVGCGMCCDGTMYQHVVLRADDDLVPLTAAGAVFDVTNGDDCFRQPCPAFGSGCCSMYEDRPAVCRKYRCALLQRFEAGEVSSDDALELIAGTTALRDQVRPAVERFVGSDHPQALTSLFELLSARFDTDGDPAALRRDNAEMLLDVTTLQRLLTRYFEPPRVTPSESGQAQPH